MCLCQRTVALPCWAFGLLADPKQKGNVLYLFVAGGAGGGDEAAEPGHSREPSRIWWTGLHAYLTAQEVSTCMLRMSACCI